MFISSTFIYSIFISQYVASNELVIINQSINHIWMNRIPDDVQVLVCKELLYIDREQVLKEQQYFSCNIQFLIRPRAPDEVA